MINFWYKDEPRSEEIGPLFVSEHGIWTAGWLHHAACASSFSKNVNNSCWDFPQWKGQWTPLELPDRHDV